MGRYTREETHSSTDFSISDVEMNPEKYFDHLGVYWGPDLADPDEDDRFFATLSGWASSSSPRSDDGIMLNDDEFTQLMEGKGPDEMVQKMRDQATQTDIGLMKHALSMQQDEL